jgi:hypothetical protein
MHGNDWVEFPLKIWIVVPLPLGLTVTVPTGGVLGMVALVMTLLVDGPEGLDGPEPQCPQLAWAGPTRPKAPALIIPPITATPATVLKFADRIVMLTLPLDLTCHEGDSRPVELTVCEGLQDRAVSVQTANEFEVARR